MAYQHLSEIKKELTPIFKQTAENLSKDEIVVLNQLKTLIMGMRKILLTDKNKFKISFVETPRKIADLMIKLISKPKSSIVLDTGCGKGIFLKSLLSEGFENVEGIEMNKELYEICKLNFNEAFLYEDDFLTWKSSKKYDVIIGNPPYAHYNSMPTEMQNEVFNITKTKESDIYYSFIMRAIDLLKENGELIYITPYGFFYNTYAEVVRKKIIENGYIELIIDLDEVKLFDGENPETIIFKFVKNKNNIPKNTKIIKLNQRNVSPEKIFEKAIECIDKKIDIAPFSYYEKQTFKTYKEIWSSHKEIEISENIKLSDIAYIGVGLVSGYDLGFRIKNNEDENFNEKEKKVIYKFIKAENCIGFWIDGNAKYILLDDDIKNEEQLSNDFPNIYKRIVGNKKEMSDRYLPNGKRWFHWQALRNRETIENYLNFPKIFVPTLDRSKENRFSITYEEVYPGGDVLVIIPLMIEPLFLVGYLNSNFFREYYLSYGARRGQRIAFTQGVLSNIKIPSFDDSVINEIKEITKEILETKDNSKRKLIDEVIINATDKKLFKKNI